MKDYSNILIEKCKIDISEILEGILSTNPERLISPFQALNPKEKIIQSYLTNYNINFGSALELLIKQYFIDKGAIYYNRDIVPGLDCDQIFSFNNKVILIEQKVRDDHDSSKKRGQVENYFQKTEYLKNNYNNVYSAFWFIDNSFKKNKRYYETTIPSNELYYGADIINFLNIIFGNDTCSDFYDFILFNIKQFKEKQNFNSDIYGNINTSKISSAKLYNIFTSENFKDFSQYFFSDGIPYEKILKERKLASQTADTKKLINFLKEQLNYE